VKAEVTYIVNGIKYVVFIAYTFFLARSWQRLYPNSKQRWRRWRGTFWDPM